MIPTKRTFRLWKEFIANTTILQRRVTIVIGLYSFVIIALTEYLSCDYFISHVECKI